MYHDDTIRGPAVSEKISQAWPASSISNGTNTQLRFSVAEVEQVPGLLIRRRLFRMIQQSA